MPVALPTIAALTLMVLLPPFRVDSAVPLNGIPRNFSSSDRPFLSSERTDGSSGAHSVPQRQGRAQKRRRKQSTSVQSQESEKNSRPDPLTLVVSIVDLKLKLNNKFVPEEGEACFGRVADYGSIHDPDNLSNCLAFIFQERTANLALKRGMEQRTDLPLDERIEKTVYLRPGLNLNDDEVAKLIEDIKKVGANPVVVLTEEEYTKKFGWVFEPITKNSSSSAPKTIGDGAVNGKARRAPRTIEGGVLNGKALSLPKPSYPSSARPLHLSGTVLVKVLIDESGKVVSARAVSGHPVFRNAAVKAAFAASFAPSTLAGQAVRVRGVIQYTFVGE
jgi:TonB family protein